MPINSSFSLNSAVTFGLISTLPASGSSENAKCRMSSCSKRPFEACFSHSWVNLPVPRRKLICWRVVTWTGNPGHRKFICHPWRHAHDECLYAPLNNCTCIYICTLPRYACQGGLQGAARKGCHCNRLVRFLRGTIKGKRNGYPGPVEAVKGLLNT